MLLLFLLGFGVTARVTRFVNSDVLAAPLRIWVMRRFGPTSKAMTLVECPWCLSIWVAAGAAAVATWAADWPLPAWIVGPGLALTWSYLYGLIAVNLDEG